MFCPQCKAEYRHGFTRCADCDVDLVYALEDAPGAPETGTRELRTQEESLRIIWKGHDESECVSLCRDLMKKDIPYKVAQITEERLQMRVIWRYEIGVLDADYERAKELLGLEGAFDAGPSVNQVLLEEGEAGDGESLPLDDSPPDKEIRNDSYFEPWYPEDAIVEIWSQDDEDISAGIQAALKENLIHCRVDLHNGVPKVFVLPEDTERSRHIVREIIEGVPPQ